MPARQESKTKIEDALCAIADGTPVSWRDLEKTSTSPAQLESLHLLDDIATLFRTDAIRNPAMHRKVLFRWSSLEVENLLGKGSYGEVYRAFDPWLGRHVALKLFRASSATGTGLDEARRLARLRHRNVLSVYGCGVHDGRAGLWSELIEGRTLAASVATDGAFSAEEAARIGRDLAQALAVVHAAGLVHGDVKAENVMRENGGRIVLMDFGAGGDARLLAGQRLISGTPRYLPPEVLDGAPLGTGSDIYALGVLLFVLLSGHYPYQATDAAALREEQRRCARATLRELQPELDSRLCMLVESCLATDSAQRPSSAPGLAAQLADLSAAVGSSVATGKRLPIVALSAACVALLAAASALIWPRLVSPKWETAVQFLRVESMGNVDLAANSTLRVGDRLRMSLRSSRDVWVYVLNEDAAGNATLLFPSGGDGLRNPLHNGQRLILPGGEGTTFAWEVTADSAREEFVVVAATEPQTELDRELAAWQRASAADTDTRAVGSIVDTPAPMLRGEHLRHILAGLGHDNDHVRVWQYTFAHGS